jgi:carboxymethylenebutenolidase
MGGRLSSLSATLGLGLAGVIPFYGWPVGPGRANSPAPVDLAGKVECDVLAFYGEADNGIPKEARDAFDQALDKAGVRHESVVYPGAPHGFFDRRAGEHADAAADAWDRVLAFIRRHTMGQPFAPSAAAAGPAGETAGATHRVAAATTDGTNVDREPIDPRVEHWAGDD